MKLEGTGSREARKKKGGGVVETDVGMILAPCLALLGETTASDSTRHDTVGLRAGASARRGTAERECVREKASVSEKLRASALGSWPVAALASLVPLCYFFFFFFVFFAERV